ncbi:monocarboxylate transporter 10-like [Notechis scutatus]|uniref:Monocarboxylate transporter 10-like n=1 Tax=Notechis scutatus TaxID=8663 RepID=A0A6J1UJM5_9SAUR|nr:monocarboxylate transporter 10-like [Notechis scutatus]
MIAACCDIAIANRPPSTQISIFSLFPVMPTLNKFRAMVKKRGLRRTCTLDEISKDISFLHPPPNGGWGWVVVLAAATHGLLVGGFHSAFGVYMMPLLDTFKSSNSQIAWIGSISYAFIMIFGPVSGKLLVKYGAIKVALIGNLVTIGGLVWSSYTHNLPMLFFTHGIIVGVGSSLAYTPGMIMVSLYFTTRRSFATGLVMAGGAAGIFVQNKLQYYLIQNLGWRDSLRVYSGILSICIIAGFAYKPLQKHRAHPSVVEKFKTSPLRGFIVDLGLWKDRIFEVWVISLGLAKFGFYIPFVHMMKLAGDLGIPLEKASYIMVGLGVSSMISSLLFGKICDIENIDRLYINQASILSVGVVYFIIPHCTSFGALVAICSLLGFFDAGNYVLLPVLTFDLMGAEKMPIAWGFMMAVNAISCFGPPFAGAMYDMYGSYTIGFVVTGVCNIAAAGILALIPWLQREAIQATKNYINASVCVITNTIVPWQSPSPSLGCEFCTSLIFDRHFITMTLSCH